ncbi:glycosyl transferase family 2 [Aliidongia dinghuensis]|uniref:Glycosyl transferase family 2 n=1 Tax=Aliidongia dinghuensis TaxID=1867774 RepID=A0A8J2Z1Z7_9PROT|nr:glycosyl transferase family 2 [Aliidongia dinghuensis]
MFNDWESFSALLKNIDIACQDLDCAVSVLAIDDGSTDPAPEMGRPDDAYATLQAVEIVHLSVNVGHQRAIAIGLAVAAQDGDADAVLIMDADGEDRPEDIARLVAAAQGQQDFVIVAERRRRNERVTFKIFYHLYKMFFKLLTGKLISFGNFSLISKSYVGRLVLVPDLWNHLPAAVMRSRLPIRRIPIDRGRRYAGSSKMNYVSLMVHGLSGISVYSDMIFVRMLIATLGLLAIGVPVILAVMIIRLFTDLATPGWATTVSFGVLMILAQAIVSTITAALLLLNNRSQKSVIPAVDYKDFLLSRRFLFQQQEQVRARVR